MLVAVCACHVSSHTLVAAFVLGSSRYSFIQLLRLTYRRAFITSLQGKQKRTTCLVPSIANSPLSLYEYRQTFRRKHQDVKHCAIAQVKKYSLRVETSEVHSYPVVVTKPSSFHQKSIVIP